MLDEEEAIQKMKISSILLKLLLYCVVEFTEFSHLIVCIYCEFWRFSIIYRILSHKLTFHHGKQVVHALCICCSKWLIGGKQGELEVSKRAI